MGAWSAIVNYVTNQAVYYGGSAWVALQASLNVAPVAGPYWSLLALGQTGSTGPQGTIAVYSAYGSGTAYSLTTSAALLNLGTTPPSVALPAAGTYLIFGRIRLDGASATVTSQTTTTYVYDSGASAIVPNSERTFAFMPVTTTSGTFAEITTPPVAYAISAPTTVQLWGFLSGALGAGAVNCIEADIVAVKIN
ncbi:MAG TPA: hypothetical protein VMQ67_08000 [Candidatus Saccharimonadales bacterium]|nr:hypothetical protein [Candidatus Saccharimonadales bacterium]